jgi:MYXO-CTERM domain-containing protein
VEPKPLRVVASGGCAVRPGKEPDDMALFELGLALVAVRRRNAKNRPRSRTAQTELVRRAER